MAAFSSRCGRLEGRTPQIPPQASRVCRSGALIGLSLFALAGASPAHAQSWQPEGIYPGFQTSHGPDYLRGETYDDLGRYGGSLPSADRYPAHVFRPLTRENKAPAVIQGYRFKEHRAIPQQQAGFRPLEHGRAKREPRYDGNPKSMTRRSYPARSSSHVYPQWSGTAPVLRPERDSGKRTRRPVFREISGSDYRGGNPEPWFAPAESPFPESGRTRTGADERFRPWSGPGNSSSVIPDLTDNYRIWEFPKRW